MDQRERGARRIATVTLLAATLGLTLGACATKDDIWAEFDVVWEEMDAKVSDDELAAAEERLGDRISTLENRTATLERRLRALADEFSTTVERMGTALRFNVPIHFAFDRAEIRAQDERVLDRYASVVKTYYPDAFITVEGFTDAAGPAAYNRRLGLRRANTVLEYLRDEGGIPGGQLRAVSYGESDDRLVNPDGVGPDDGIANRRVALVIDHATAGGEGSGEAETSSSPSSSSSRE